MRRTEIQSWAATEPGGMLEPYTRTREVGPDQIVVDAVFVSLTRGDIGFIDNRWGDTRYPVVAGSEIIGKISDPGDSGLQVGEVVGMGYQVGACFACEYCQAGKEQFCAEQRLVPVHEPGGYSDKVVVDSRFVFRLPPELQGPEAAPLLSSGLTVFSAIRRAEVQSGMEVAVVGVGNLGHLAIKVLRAMGCTVSAVTRSTAKEPAIRALGVGTVLIGEQTMPLRTYDAVLITSTGKVDWGACVRSLKPEGVLSVVGLPPNPITVQAEALADLASRRIQGGYIGSRQDTREVLAFALEHSIRADTVVYPIEQINQAITDIRAGAVPFSTVLVNSVSL